MKDGINKVLTLGGTGILGRELWQSFRGRFDTCVTFRRPIESHFECGLFGQARALTGVTAEDSD